MDGYDRVIALMNSQMQCLYAQNIHNLQRQLKSQQGLCGDSSNPIFNLEVIGNCCWLGERLFSSGSVLGKGTHVPIDGPVSILIQKVQNGHSVLNKNKSMNRNLGGTVGGVIGRQWR